MENKNERITRIPCEPPPENWRDRMKYSEEVKGMVWTATTSYRIKNGEPVGSSNPHTGRKFVKLENGIAYNIEDLVWMWFHNEFSKHPLIHMNGDISDNRIENLVPDRTKLRPVGKKRKKTGNTPRGFAYELDSDLSPEYRLVCAVIKRALKDAKQEVKKLKKKGYSRSDIILKSEPVRFLLGRDGRLDFWIEFTPLNKKGLTETLLKEAGL